MSKYYNNNPMGINFFDAILYINLDHRIDRKEILLDQLAKLGVNQKKIHRISAVKHSSNGYIGTVLSHIKALDFAIVNNFNNALILEDDCLFFKKPLILNSLIDYFFDKIPVWDVFLLGGQFFKTKKTKYPHIINILKSYDCHAYAINKDYMKILKNCFMESYEEIKNDSFAFQSAKVEQAILDVYWNKLQCRDNWYSLDVQLAIQNDSYSDNLNRQRNYFKEIGKKF